MFYTLRIFVLCGCMLHVFALSGNCATSAAAGSDVDVLPSQGNGSLCNLRVSSSSSEAGPHEDYKGTSTFRVFSTPSSRPPLHSLSTSPERRRVHVCLARSPRDSLSATRLLSAATPAHEDRLILPPHPFSVPTLAMEAAAPARESSTTLATSSSLRTLFSRLEEETRMVDACIEMLETSRKYLLDYMPRYVSDAFDVAGKARACAADTQEAFNATLDHFIVAFFKQDLKEGRRELVKRVSMQIRDKLIEKYLGDI